MMRERFGEVLNGIEWMESLPLPAFMHRLRMGQFDCLLEPVSRLAREILNLIHSEFIGQGSVKNRRSRVTPANRVFSCLATRTSLGVFEPAKIHDSLVCSFLSFQRNRKSQMLIYAPYE